MTTDKKRELRVIFWHNDFNDGMRQHKFYGTSGPVAEKIRKLLNAGQELKWHFHGGFIHPGRTMLMRRLEKADVFISAYPHNMDIQDDDMHWDKAEESLLKILQEVKKNNPNLKIFFLQEPHLLKAEFSAIGDYIFDVHDEKLYKYFQEKRA